MKAMTTVQMDKPLVKELEKLRTKYKFKSYKAVVWKLVEKEKQIPDSMFGSFPKLGKFKREKEDEYRQF
ncbi:MAG: hypothetical protein V1777_04765 [Candidatus Micrarchaeota archaeon]